MISMTSMTSMTKCYECVVKTELQISPNEFMVVTPQGNARLVISKGTNYTVQFSSEGKPIVSIYESDYMKPNAPLFELIMREEKNQPIDIGGLI